MKKLIRVMFALLLCLAALPAAAMAAEADDSWIEERLRALENQYNSGIAPLSFVEGYIPWTTETTENPNGRQYFIVSGLPSTLSDEWLADCAKVSPQGYKVDNTGVKYTKFPRYDANGYHFVNVTVNDVEVVRIGILMPDNDPNGAPTYYYMTQKHVDSDDTSDGSGSHTGSISALVLPDGAQFKVNYAVNEYTYSYEIQLNGEDVTNEIVDPTASNPVTWLQTIFAGQNPSSTTNGAISFTVTIPYGYTARVLRYEYDNAKDVWKKDPIDLTSKGAPRPVNGGYPLGTEPTYVYVSDGQSVPDTTKGPSAKTMSAVFYDDTIGQNRKIVVELIKDVNDPIFDAHFWLSSKNAEGRGATAENALLPDETGYVPNLFWSKGGGNVQPEKDQWNWNDGVFAKDPQKLTGDDVDTYATHWYQDTDGTWTLIWAFQTNGNNSNWILNSLELNGEFIDIPFKPQNNWNDGDVPNTESGTSVTQATLSNGAAVELTFYRLFNGGGPQRVYILKITGARSNITVTGGNLMLYGGGAPEYVATVLTGVTAKSDGSDCFGYYSNWNTWESQDKVAIQVQTNTNGTEAQRRATTNFAGDAEHYFANLRFQLQEGYENPVYLWEDRVSGIGLEGSAIRNAHGVISWEDVKSHLDSSGKLLPNAIYGPVVEKDENGRDQEWYYIRIDQSNQPGGSAGHKMCVLNLTATAMRYMVRYMVGSQSDPFTNAPSEDKNNVQGMPEFDTSNDSWDDNLQASGGLEGQHLERYDDNNGNFYDRQTTSTIPVSDAVPTTKDEKKFFQYWVLVDKDEKVIKDANDTPIIVRPNETMDLASFAEYGVALSTDIGGTDNNYYVLRLKGVWSDLPTNFEFYIRMVWTDENGKSHIMDLVQNVITSSTDPNLTDDGCLIVTVNTVTDTFQDWFKAHPFYAYADRNFIATTERKADQFLDQDNNIWEAYPDQFTLGSTEQGLNNKDRYYRVEVGADNIVRYIVQREGTIILYLDEVNGSLPISKTVIGSDPGADEFTYTVTVKLLSSDIARADLEQGDPNYLTRESLKNMLPSGTYFGFAPSADMTDLSAFTGTDVELHFKRHAADNDDMANWYSTATFKLKGGEATVLGVPQGSYTITEEAGPAYTVTVETDGKALNGATLSNKEIRASKIATAVKYSNEVTPIEAEDTPLVSTKITGTKLPDDLWAIFSYTLELIKGDASQIEYQSQGTTLTTKGPEVVDSPFGNIIFKHTGTYQFLVTETLQELADKYENTLVPSTSTRALTIEVTNIDGQLTVTKITVDGTVYEGIEGDHALANAVVPFTHSYMPVTENTVRVIPTVYKKLNGRELLSASFMFELTYDGTTYTATNNAAANGERGTVPFPAIDFPLPEDGAPDEYTVTVKEMIPNDNGAADHITYDDSVITITYTVEIVDGEPKVTEAYSDGRDTFENQAYADAGFTVKKNYDLSLRPGGRWDNDTFTVTATLTNAPADAVVGVNGTTTALNETVGIVLTEAENVNGKIFDFRFTKEGVYTFEVRETNEGHPGVSYDGSIYYVTVEVTAEGKSLAAKMSITKNGKAITDGVVTFDNKYDPNHLDVIVNASKVLQNANGQQVSLTADRFKFELIPAGQTPGSILTAKNDANGNVTFTLQNLSAGTYEYMLREIDDGENGVTYDPREYAVTITVVKQEDSAVTYTIQYADGDNAVTVPTFTNTLNGFGQLIVTNTVTGDGADPDKEFTYTFTFEGTSDAFRYELRSSASSYSLFETLIMPLFAPEGTAVTDTISSGGSIQLRDGQSVIIYGLPAGTSYKVVESDYDAYAVSHDGTDGDTASGMIGNDNTLVNYTNTLNPKEPEVTITKAQAVNGAASESPATVKAEDEVTYTITVKNEGERPAQAVIITDEVPAGLVVTGIDNDGQNNNGTITWTIDALNAGESYSVSFTVTIPTITENQTWDNTAAVQWDGDTTGNISAPVRLTAAALGNLMLSKTIMPIGDVQLDTAKEFTFTVKLLDGSSPRSGSFGYEGGIVQDSGATAPEEGTLIFDENGEATATLKHGQTMTIKGIPAGLSYIVTEETTAGYTPSISNGNGLIEANSTAEVSVTNTYGMASITAAVPEITKTLTGRNLEDGEFTFSISCEPMDGIVLPGLAANDADGKVQFGPVTFTKPGTYRVTVREVIPMDATNNTKNGVTYDTHAVEFTYVVADNQLGGLTVTSPTVSSEGGEDDKLFTNTFAGAVIGSGQLIVSKQVTGNAGEADRSFRCEAEIGGNAYAFTLRSGEQWTSALFDAGTEYAVRELDANVDGYTTVVPANAVGTIQDGAAVYVTFINNKDSAEPSEPTPTPAATTGSLSIRKQVTGTAGDPQAEFTFMVMLSDTSISGLYGDVTFSKGVATFTLKHGESKIATGLPAGIRYSVQELSANHDGYATTASGETGMITADTVMTAIFVNAKDVVDVPQTGDNSHIEMWLALAFASLVSMISIKRRRAGIRK